MPLAENSPSHLNTINAYEDDSISVSNREYKTSFLMSPNTLSTWPVSSLDDFSIDQCEQILALKPQVVLLGTGEKQLFPKPEIYAFFGQHQIGLEVMANHAACRTYNILVSEDRNVVVGFIL